MVVSSTLVNVSEDAEMRIVTLLADAAPSNLLGSSFRNMCASSISNGDASGLLKAVVKDIGAISSLTVLDAEEATAAMSILAALLNRVSNSDDQTKIASALADAVAKSGSGDTAVLKRKMLLLSILYNMRDSTNDKVVLLGKMIQLSAADPGEFLHPESTLGCLLDEPTHTVVSGKPGSSSSAVTSAMNSATVPKLVAMLDDWSVPSPERQSLYRTVSSVLPESDIRKQRFLLLLTESYSTSVGADGVQTARECAIGAIRDPITLFVHQRNLLQQPAVLALEKKDAKLFGLLKVFQEGKISDYNDFIAKNGGSEDDLLGAYGLDASSCRRNMRILSLCSLASEHESIPYSSVAKTLQLDDEKAQVEAWVIAAVGSGLLEAKMDQLKEIVMVQRSVIRRFDTEQWKALQTRLLSWKQSIGGILQALKEHQPAETTP